MELRGSSAWHIKKNCLMREMLHTLLSGTAKALNNKVF